MFRDVRFALQLLAKDRWYAAVAIAALSLGIGVNAAVFTLVDAVLIRGLPFKDSSQLYMLGSSRAAGGDDAFGPVSYADLQDWRAASRTFSDIAATTSVNVNVSDDRNAAQQARSTIVTTNTFAVLEQQPLLGRDFSEADGHSGAQAVAILGYTLWQTRYNGDPSIVGRTIRINAAPVTVVGVMPPDMMFPATSELWQPFVPSPIEQKRSTRDLEAFGRLRPTATLAQAQAEMNGIARRLAAAYPDTNKDVPIVTIETFNDRYNGGAARAVFLSMMGAVGFLLLIACANVANLLLSRSAQRAREIAVRIALGATRWTIVRQLLVESVLLGAISGAIGLGLAEIGVRLFDAAIQSSGKPYWIVFRMDYLVFGFLAVVCVLTGILFGLAPALHVSRTNVNEVLKEGGRGNAGGRRAQWLTSSMVVVELALTIVLLVGAGLMVRSFLRIYTLDLGIQTDHLLTMRMLLPTRKYPASPAASGGPAAPSTRMTFYDRLLPKIASIPGVEAAALTTSVPPYGGARRALEIEGNAPLKTGEQAPRVTTVFISPAFFRAAGVQLPRGRTFDDRDGTPGNDAVIVNQHFVRRFFGNEDPIGRRVRLTAPDATASPSSIAAPQWRTIVGVSPDIRHASPQDAEPPSVVYVPVRQEPPAAVFLIIRSSVEPSSVIAAVRSDVQSIDPDQPVYSVQTMDQLLAQARWPYRVFGVVFSVFAAIALVMAAVGLYAVMAYSVTQRTAEIGVRMALGANARAVSWLILKRAIVQLAIGLPLGIGGAVALSRVLQALLAQISPTDPLTFSAITLLLVVVALAACLVPIRRATRVDPLVALRTE